MRSSLHEMDSLLHDSYVFASGASVDSVPFRGKSMLTKVSSIRSQRLS